MLGAFPVGIGNVFAKLRFSSDTVCDKPSRREGLEKLGRAAFEHGGGLFIGKIPAFAADPDSGLEKGKRWFVAVESDFHPPLRKLTISAPFLSVSR